MSLVRSVVFVSLMSLFASACGPVAERTIGPISVARTSAVTLVQITKENVGGITKDTTYGMKAIAAALPGFTTEGIQTAVENRTEWAIAAFNSDGFQVLQVFKGSKGKIRTVHGVTHHLAGPNGERIGMTFSETRQSRGNCRVGRNLWRGMAICKVSNAKNVELVFAIPGYGGPFDRLPSSDKLNKALLQRILWTPIR